MGWSPTATFCWRTARSKRPADRPIYASIDDPADAIAGNSHHAWSMSMSASKVTRVWPALGDLVDIRVTKRTGGGVWDGWVDQMTLVGTKTSINLSGDQFRRGMKLKSRYLNFTLVRTPEQDKFDNAKKFGMEIFKDENTGGLIYVTESGAIAPAASDNESSGTMRCGSKSHVAPRPWHALHAPCGELNENARGVTSGMLTPQSGQAQSAGMSSQRVPATTPSSGMPTASS